MNTRYSPASMRAFELFFQPWMRRRIHGVHMAGMPALDPGGPAVLLVANHVSWWDGLILREVHRMVRPDAPLYTVMAEEQLRHVPYFRRLGVVGIDRGEPSSILRALHSLERHLHEHPSALVAFFPQGRIWPTHRRPLGFERGVELLLRRLPLVAFPVGLHLEPLTHAAPSFFVSIGDPIPGRPSALDLERQVEAQLDAIHAFLAEHGEGAPQRWPPPDRSLPAVASPTALPGAQ